MLQLSEYLWGEKIHVVSIEHVAIQQKNFSIHYVKASDDTYALLVVDSIKAERNVYDVKDFLVKHFSAKQLDPHFVVSRTQLFLASIEPIHSFLHTTFPSRSFGIVILINGLEMGNGTYALNHMHLKSGDTMQILYRIGRN